MINTIDVLKVSVEEADKELGKKMELSEQRMKEMEDACKIIDYLLKDFKCSAYETDVDMSTATVLISIECDDIILEKKVSHPFFKLLDYATGFEITNINGETMRLTFIFDGVWNSVREVND